MGLNKPLGLGIQLWKVLFLRLAFNSKADSSWFIYRWGSISCYFLVYVDDFVITGNNFNFVASTIKQLGDMFSLKELSLLHFFLGVEVIPTCTGLFLSQHKNMFVIYWSTPIWLVQRMSPVPFPLASPFNWLMAQLLWIVQNFIVLLEVFSIFLWHTQIFHLLLTSYPIYA